MRAFSYAPQSDLRLAFCSVSRQFPCTARGLRLTFAAVNSNFLEGRSAAPTEGGSVPADSDINLQTQIKLLQSDSLLLEVTDRLLAEPHPKSIEKGDRLSIILRAVHLGHLETIPYKQLVSDTAQRIKVKPLGLTRLVEITCDSEDAKFSATFCNTLTSTFDQQDLRARATEAQKTSEWLTRQAADIRAKAEDGQKKLEAAIGNNGLLLSQTPAGTGEDRLRSLQEELVRSEADRMAKEAQVSVAKTVSPETVANVQDDPAYRAYELKLAELRTKVSSAGASSYRSSSGSQAPALADCRGGERHARDPDGQHIARAEPNCRLPGTASNCSG